jgi:putative alpha-1,2-mannosidase
VAKLQNVFDEGLYDPANEPDIAYPYLFSYFKGEEWRTSKIVSELLDKHYTTRPDGLPGNDDTGTMSAWAVFSMMGFYPDCPGNPSYTLTMPRFDRVEITLDPKYNGGRDRLVITKDRPAPEGGWLKVTGVTLGGTKISGSRVSHRALTGGGQLDFRCGLATAQNAKP